MRLKHPITRADYLRNTDGTVTVTGRSGGVGLFDRQGRWLEGDIRHADPLMCMFVSDGYSTRAPTPRAVPNTPMNTEAS